MTERKRDPPRPQIRRRQDAAPAPEKEKRRSTIDVLDEWLEVDAPAPAPAPRPAPRPAARPAAARSTTPKPALHKPPPAPRAKVPATIPRDEDEVEPAPRRRHSKPPAR